MPKILIIDDKEIERNLAIQACKLKGIEYIVCDPTSDDWRWFDKMSDVDGVITDLFWKRNHPSMEGKEDPPQGLPVVIHGLSLGKPVVVCTDAVKTDTQWGHHGAAVGWLHSGYINQLNSESNEQNPPAFSSNSGYLPFGWQEDKDWPAAIDKVLARISQTK